MSSTKEELREQQLISEKKEKVIAWLKDKHNLALVAILVFSFAVRLFFLINTNGQALWWDEAEYMATAKHWAFGVDYNVNMQRPPLFQLLAAFLLKTGFEEFAIKFLLVFLPSFFLVFFIYLLGKELFNKRIGLFAAAAASAMWDILFWSSRFQPDFFSMCFQVLAFLFFWKMFKYNSSKSAVLAGVFAALGFYFKISALLVPMSVFAFAIFKDGWKALKNKNYWICLFSFFAAFIPFFIWQYLAFGNPIAFAPSYASSEERAGRALGWMALNYFYSFQGILLFIPFLIGIISFLFIFLASIDLYFKDEKKEPNPWLYAFLVLLVSAAYHIFFTKGTIEDRWIFTIIPFLFFFSAKGVFSISDYLKKYNKFLGAILVVALLVVFFYSQINHTNSLNLVKKESYMPVKQASLWIKQNMPEGEALISASYTQAVAYSERKVIHLLGDFNESSLLDAIKNKNATYLMVSVFEPHPQVIYSWIEKNQASLTPVQAYFTDAQKTQYALILYKINPSSF